MTKHAAWTRVLLAPWQQRRNQGSLWSLALIAAMVASLTLAASVFIPQVPLMITAAALALPPMSGAWAWFFLSLMLQNHPHAARFVPGHLRTLRTLLVVVWLLFTGVAALFGWAFGHAGLAAGAAALAMLLVAWLVRAPWLGAVVWIATASSPHWTRTRIWTTLNAQSNTAWHRQPTLVVCVLVIALLAAAVVSGMVLLQAGGRRHARRYRAREQQRAAVRPGALDARWKSVGAAAWLRDAASWPYRHWLVRVSAQRDGAVLPRALLGLGPGIHWTGQLGQAMTSIALAGLILLVAWQIYPDTNFVSSSGVAWGLAFGVMSLSFVSALQARAAIHVTRREQALLMLLPGMPQGPLLNRQLARRLMCQFIGWWVLSVSVCLLFLPRDDMSIGWAITFATACLPIGATVWSDWSRIRAPTPLSGVAPLLLAMLATAGAIAAQLLLGVAVLWCALAFATVAVMLAAWRGWRLQRAPSAFPAGRRV